MYSLHFTSEKTNYFVLAIFLRIQLNTYSRSQNNVNKVYCNYKGITSSYSVITKRTMVHSLPNLGDI